MACAGKVLVTIPLSAFLATNWIHKKSSGHISGRLGYVADFRCRRCLDGDCSGSVVE